LSDQLLIRELQNGNTRAFHELVTTYQQLVYNTVLSMVQQAAEAEDIAQEVFIQVFRSIGKFRGDSQLGTWIYRIAVRKAIDWERRKKLRSRIQVLGSWLGVQDTAAAQETFYHPGIVLEQKERAAQLFKAMKALPEKQRICFVLIRVEGLSYAQAAEVMELSVKAVESLMQRAKENLRKLLES
jgi:RNA polymerase sigma-70 factor (ECF subfamily)